MADEYRVCCNLLHVKTATWIIAIVHFVLAFLILITGGLYYLGIIDTYQRSRTGFSYVDSAGFTGWMVAAALWMLFICLLIYGLKNNRAVFVLLHWVFVVILWTLNVLNIALYVWHVLTSEADLNVYYLLESILFAVAIASLLYVEFKCYQFIKFSYTLRT